MYVGVGVVRESVVLLNTVNLTLLNLFHNQASKCAVNNIALL